MYVFVVEGMNLDNGNGVSICFGVRDELMGGGFMVDGGGMG